jgi:hypothetical protein
LSEVAPPRARTTRPSRIEAAETPERKVCGALRQCIALSTNAVPAGPEDNVFLRR